MSVTSRFTIPTRPRFARPPLGKKIETVEKTGNCAFPT
jgi:hypothetical protein